MDKNKRIELLQELIQIKSVNGKEHDVAEFFRDLFTEYGITSEIIEHSEGRSNLIAEITGGDAENKKIGLSGHFDVVSEGTHDNWAYPAFAAEIHEGKMYGRGTSDMKAGTIAFAIAMIELKEAGLPINGTVRFLGTVGEEVGMLGSFQLADGGYADDIDGFFLSEPTDDSLINVAHKGSIQMEVHSYGKSAHSSTPEEGINSIQQIVTFINRLNEEMDKVVENYTSEVLGKTSNSVTTIEGGSQINSIPGKTVLGMNARTIDAFPNDKLIALIEDVISEVNKEIEGSLELQVNQSVWPVEADENSDLVQAAKAILGEDLRIEMLPGATDASNFIRVNPDADLIIYGPGKMNLAHQDNEYVEVTKYLSFIDETVEIIKEYLK